MLELRNSCTDLYLFSAAPAKDVIGAAARVVNFDFIDSLTDVTEEEKLLLKGNLVRDLVRFVADFFCIL